MKIVGVADVGPVEVDDQRVAPARAMADRFDEDATDLPITGLPLATTARPSRLTSEVEAYVTEDVSQVGTWVGGLIPEIHKPQVDRARGHRASKASA